MTNSNKNFLTYLCLDYGTKRIGVAVSIATLAQPLTILSNNKKVFQSILELCQKHTIDTIIVGISENVMADKTKLFVAELKKHIDIPIQFFDETLSSKEVHKKIATSGMKKKKRQAPIDHLAAAHILQDYLATL